MRSTVQKIKGLYPRRFIENETYQLAKLRHAPEMAEILWEVKRAFDLGIDPTPCDDGCSDSYFLNGEEGVPLAIFKLDSFLREYSAYRLDHKHFANVPPTVIAKLDHPIWGGEKLGSCQLFIAKSISAVNLPLRKHQEFYPSPIRRMAILDIRMMNEDRHSSNILIVNQNETIPIDHGFIFPQELSHVNFIWLDWKQAKTPFTEEELSYISLLDPEEDRRILIEELQFKEKYANRMYIATVLLKQAATYQYSAFQTGNLMTRDQEKPSVFEQLLDNLKMKEVSNWTLFTRYIYEEVERILEKHDEKKAY